LCNDLFLYIGKRSRNRFFICPSILFTNDNKIRKNRKQHHHLRTATMERTKGNNNNSRRHRLQDARGPFHVVGCLLMGRNADLAAAATTQRFRANFGVGPVVCNFAWKLLRDNGQTNGAEPKHLLYALKWLKIYGTEHVLAGDLRIDEKTLRKWVWRFVYALSDLESDVVSIFQRFFLFIPVSNY
jgi:hypothetical protein